MTQRIRLHPSGCADPRGRKSFTISSAQPAQRARSRRIGCVSLPPPQRPRPRSRQPVPASHDRNRNPVPSRRRGGVQHTSRSQPPRSPPRRLLQHAQPRILHPDPTHASTHTPRTRDDQCAGSPARSAIEAPSAILGRDHRPHRAQSNLRPLPNVLCPALTP